MEARRMPAQEGPLGEVYIRRDQDSHSQTTCTVHPKSGL